MFSCCLFVQGSVFAEFKDKKVAEDFLDLPKIELKGRELLKESKYVKRIKIYKKSAKFVSHVPLMAWF